MTTRNLRGMFQCGVLLALLGASAASPALELGTPVARSGIGEPLLVDVPITGTPEQLRALTVQPVDWSTHITAFQIPPPLPAGTTYSFNNSVIEIRSDTAVTEPYVGVALQLSTPQAIVVHPVTVLLNPPGYLTVTNIAKPEAAPPDGGNPPQRYGPVREGETLTMIARSLQTHTPASVEQIMWALFNANPHAFAGGADGLKADTYLSVPPASAITAIEPRRARAQLHAARSVRPQSTPELSVEPTAAVPHMTFNAVATTELPSRNLDAALPASTDAATARDSGTMPEDNAVTSSGSTANAIDQLTRRVAVLAEQAETLRSQLAQRDEEVAWLQDDLRLQGDSRAESHVLTTIGMEWLILLATIGGSILFLFGMWTGGRRASAEEYAEPEWIPELDDSALAQPEDASVTAASSTQTTISLRPKSTESEDPLGADELDFKLQTRPFGEPHDIDFSETDPIDELEAYIAKGQYAQAKNLLGRLINLFPDENSFRLYLLKILYAGREDEPFHEHALYLHERRDRITDEEWQEVVTMGAALMPDEALYARTDGAEPVSVDSTRVIEFRSSKTVTQISHPMGGTLTEEEQVEVAAFLNDLRNNENAP